MTFLQVQHLKKSFTNGDVILKDINFTLEKGEVVAILGESGVGKTTLLNVIAGLTVSDAGILEFSEQHQIGFIFQESELWDSLSVRDNILLPTVMAEINLSISEKILLDLSDKFGTHDILDLFPDKLSSEQKQKVSIIRALITEPNLILADELTSQVDIKVSEMLINNLLSVISDNQTVLIVTHDSYIASFSDKVLFLKEGEIFNQITRADDGQIDFLKQIRLAQSI